MQESGLKLHGCSAEVIGIFQIDFIIGGLDYGIAESDKPGGHHGQ